MVPTLMTIISSQIFLTRSSLTGNYIIGGDWNCVLDPTLDRASGADQTHTRSRETICEFMKELNLVDIGRLLKPTEIIYSCHSSTFRTYSRMDYYFDFSGITLRYNWLFYDSIVLSDHAPCNLIYSNNKLLKDLLDGACTRNGWKINSLNMLEKG